MENALVRRVGLLVPSSDTIMEPDLWRRLPVDMSLHVARMYLESTTVAGEEKMLQEELLPAAERIASAQPEMIVFGCTSAAALHGLEGDTSIAERIAKATGAHAITVTQAAIRAIRKLAPARIFLFTPYVPELTQRLEHTFREADLPVCDSEGLGIADDLRIAAVAPQEIKESVVRAVHRLQRSPDTIFISCTTFRAFEASEAIHSDLGIPVVTSNQAALGAIVNHFQTQPSAP